VGKIQLRKKELMPSNKETRKFCLHEALQWTTELITKGDQLIIGLTVKESSKGIIDVAKLFEAYIEGENDNSNSG
jgi:hypothetical protein